MQKTQSFADQQTIEMAETPAQDELILGRYKPLTTKGAGGSGTVFLCWDLTIQRKVAIKRIPIDQTNESELAPGLAEARTGAMLRHENIVSVIDFQVEDDCAFLIMEAIEGPSVSQLLDEVPGNALDLDIIAYITDAVAEALDFAHSNGVLHLDIKPDNILIDPYGNVKVSDFGVSELAGAQGYGQACGGTIGYMPPEQIRGLDMDQRTDAFALAATVYEMVTGCKPFGANNLQQSLRRIEQGNFNPISRICRDIDADIDEVMASALSADPQERFETALETADELIYQLGDPEQGAQKLAGFMQGEEEQEEGERASFKGWDQLQPSTRKAFGRVALAFLGALTCYPGAEMLLTNIAPTFQLAGQVPSIIVGVLTVVGAALCAVVPPVGAMFSTLLTCIGCSINAVVSTNTALWIAPGVIALLCAAIWVVLSRERKNSEAAVLLLACISATLPGPALLTASCMPLAVLICGRSLRLARCLETTVLAAVLSLALATSCACSFENLFTWQTALCLVGWIFSALFMSALCSKQSRVLSEVGVFVACAIMIVAQCLGGFLATGYWLYDTLNLESVTGVVIALVLMGIACALGTPLSEKEEG